MGSACVVYKGRETWKWPNVGACGGSAEATGVCGSGMVRLGTLGLCTGVAKR